MKKWLKITLITAGVALVLFLLGCAVVYNVLFNFDTGPAPVSCYNIAVDDSGIEFDADYYRDGFLMYSKYTFTTEGDCMYIQIHASLGGYTWPHHVSIPYDMTGINEVYTEDEDGAYLIWSRE